MDTASNSSTVTTATTAAVASTVQHVTKKSSDELLRKFAEMGDDDGGGGAYGVKRELRVSRRVKRRRTRKCELVADDHSCESPSHYSSTTLAEKRSLLPPVTRKSRLLRQLGIERSQLRARDIKSRSILTAIEKAWRRTLEGASKVLLEKHYGRHRRLINDAV